MINNKEKIQSSFERKGFKTQFFETKEEALSYLDQSLDGKEIGIGGSLSVKEIGLYDVLSKHNNIHWHWVDNSKDTRLKAIMSEVYILSANGVSETGELVNIDGSGNRLASSLFGPKKIIYIIGKNKIEPNLERAIWRAKNIAAPKNALRFNLNTPCVKAGGKMCFDCNSPDRICNGLLVVSNPMKSQEVELIFIDEELGY